MVHMTMRSVKPSCLNVSAHTRPAGPAEMFDEENTRMQPKSDRMWIDLCCLRSEKFNTLTWANDDNVAKPPAGVDDRCASSHRLWPFLCLKSLKCFWWTQLNHWVILLSHVNSQHSFSHYLLVCTNDHFVLFNSDLKQTDMSRVYTFWRCLEIW